MTRTEKIQRLAKFHNNCDNKLFTHEQLKYTCSMFVDDEIDITDLKEKYGLKRLARICDTPPSTFDWRVKYNCLTVREIRLLNELKKLNHGKR